MRAWDLSMMNVKLLDWMKNWLTVIQFYNHYENQDSWKFIYNYRPAAGGVWRLYPPPKVLLAYVPQDGQSLMSCKGILKDASTAHVMSKPIPIIYSTSAHLLQIWNTPTIAKAKMKLLQSAECRLGDDNQFTNGINLRKSLAPDSARIKLYATSGQ